MGKLIGNAIGIPFGRGEINWTNFWSTRTPSGLIAIPLNDTQVDLSLTENGTGFNGYSWERSEDLGLNYVEIDTTLIGDPTTSDITFTEPMILKYRARAYKGIHYSPYTSVVTVYPAGVRINSANTSVLLADAASEFYFCAGGVDKPFSVLAIAKSNNLAITNTLLSRGDINGCSYNIRLNTAAGRFDFVIYGSDLTNNNLLYIVTNQLNDSNINKIVYTYSGNEDYTGMKIYKNGALCTNIGGTSAKYGVYSAMNNRTGFNIGRQIKDTEQGNFDLYTLLVCNKALSQAEVTEFQNMASEDDIDTLSFYANIKTINGFAGTLTDDLGVHNGSSTDPAFFFMNDYIEDARCFLPSITETTFQSTFKTFKLGWFICYGIETYNGDESDGKTLPTSLSSIFTAPSTVDVAAWATLADSYGKIDYAILTVSHIYGFSLYNHQTAEWRGLQIDVGGGIIVPTYMKYDVGSSGCTADKNIVTKFITEFNAVNIKPILYYCVGWARNWCGDQWPKDSYADPDYQFTKYHDYVRERLQELARLTPFAIWIDVETYYPPGYTYDLYNAIKAINSEIGVIVNSWTNKDRTDNSFGPFDAGSTEEAIQPALPTDDWWTQIQVINGINYPCMKELSFTSRVNKWFYSSSPATLRTIVALQAEYDYAKTAGIPCVVSVNPKLDGVIDQTQADLVGSIVL